jgi:hypothetical protein
MNINPAMSSGLAALTLSSQQLAGDAQQIANPDTPDVTAPLVQSLQALLAAQAAAAVIKTADQTLGTLLDTHA